MKLILQTLLFTFSLFSSAQEFTLNDFNPLLEKDGLIIHVGEGIFIETSNNTSHTKYFFKFQNTTNEDLILQFNKELYYDGECYGSDNTEGEQQYRITIKANSVASFEENPYDKSYSVFKKDNNGWIKKQLTDFKLTHVQISKVK